MICPRCGSDLIRVDSSREMQTSEIRCTDCDFGFRAPVTEEAVQRMWGCIEKGETADDEEQEALT